MAPAPLVIAGAAPDQAMVGLAAMLAADLALKSHRPFDSLIDPPGVIAPHAARPAPSFPLKISSSMSKGAAPPATCSPSARPSRHADSFPRCVGAWAVAFADRLTLLLSATGGAPAAQRLIMPAHGRRVFFPPSGPKRRPHRVRLLSGGDSCKSGPKIAQRL